MQWSIEEPNTGCWIWLGARNRYGYGLATAWDQAAQRHKIATTHRLAYALWIGSIPENLFVCHRCDNPPCINPKHLFVGTADDNNKDMCAKGRGRHLVGDNHGRAKCSSEMILAVRAAVLAGENQYEIAARFGISQPMVSLIKTGRTWRHLLNG